MHQQFLQAILAEPDEDTHRLAYADWLNEQNGGVDPPRAEFIRVQIEYEQLDAQDHPDTGGDHPRPPRFDDLTCPLCSRMAILRRRAQNLVLDTKPGQWSGFPPPLCEPGRAHWSFNRGFVEYIRLSAQDWLAHADELVQAAPIREVELSSLPVRQNLGDNDPSAQLITAAQETPVAQTWNGVEYHVRYKAYSLGRETVTIEGEFASYGHRQCCEELLRANWPHITFVLPPEPETHTVHWTGSVLEVPAAESIALGEFVARTPDGRVRRTPHRDGAVGIAVRSSVDNFVRVHLLEPFPAD